MVGKPNLSETGDYRGDLRGSARATPGLAALDEEREASMADEGGASGAVMESEDEAAVPRLAAGSPDRRRLHRALFFAGAAGGLALGLWWYRR